MYGWNRIKLVYEQNGMNIIAERFCHLVAEALHLPLLMKTNFTQDYYKISNAATEITNKTMEEKIGNQFASKCVVVNIAYLSGSQTLILFVYARACVCVCVCVCV